MPLNWFDRYELEITVVNGAGSVSFTDRGKIAQVALVPPDGYTGNPLVSFCILDDIGCFLGGSANRPAPCSADLGIIIVKQNTFRIYNAGVDGVWKARPYIQRG